MVAQNADVNALLAKLSKAKPLPKATQAITSPTQQLQTQIRDSVIENVRRAPSLQESLNAIAQGQQSQSNPALGVAAKVFGNPVVKTALMPLVAFDTGRRGVISGVREVTDLLDNNPNTKASINDFNRQMMDTSFGYGTAFPMEGWKGRILGFVGDVALDPLTYATLGGAVPASASLRGTNIATRAALGAAERGGKAAKILGRYKPVRFATAESRNNLASVVGNQARHINLLDDAERNALGLIKRSESDIQKIEQNIAKFGKTRVPVDIAKDIGLPKSGIYWFGSRVRMPLSGPIGKALELGLARGRTAFTAQATGAIGRFMDSIIPEGIKSDAINVKQMRKALITGNATPEEASMYLKMLDNNRERRVIENFAKQEYNRRFTTEIANNPTIQQHKDVIHELLENPERLASASPSELQAYEIVQKWFTESADAIEKNLQRVDPSFKLNRVQNYFPHQQTEKAINYVDDLRNPFAEELRVYLKTDIADPSAAFSKRGLTKDARFFGVKLTDKDVAGGVARLNQIAREQGKIDFDFFETDALKALAKYGESFASEISRGAFLERQLQNGVLKYLADKGIYDTTALKELELAVRESIKGVTKSTNDVAITAKALRQNLEQALQDFVPALKKEKTLAGKKALAASRGATAAKKSLADTKRTIDALVQALENTGIRNASARWQQFGISGILPESIVDGPLTDILNQLDEISNYTKTFNDLLATGEKSIADLTDEFNKLTKAASNLEKQASEYASKVVEFDSIHATLGEFVNGKYSNLAMEGAEEGGGESFERVVNLLKNQSLRDKINLENGKIPQKKVAALWGDASASRDPRVAALRQWLDPNKKITQKAIKDLTIENVRDIISRSTIKATSLTELKEALTWLVIRDLDRSPTLLDSVVSQIGKGAAPVEAVDGNSLASLINDSGTITRIANIKETINKISRLDELMNNAARKTKDNQVVYSVAEIADKQAQLIALEAEIAEKVSALALIKGSPEAMPLRAWKEISQNKSNEIISDPTEIENLFNNLKSVVFEEEEGVFDSAINALKAVGLENQQLTYGDVDNLLTTYLEDIGFRSVPTDEAGKEILKLQEDKTKLLNEINKKAGLVDAEIKDEIASKLDSRSYAETVLAYSNEALEYYVYSEAKNQFTNLMDELEPWGVVPSYGVYQRVLSDVAHNHIAKTKQFYNEVEKAEEILDAIRTEVLQPSGVQVTKKVGEFVDANQVPYNDVLAQSINPNSAVITARNQVSSFSKNQRLRELLQEALKDKVSGPILDNVFPELRGVVTTGKITEFSRVQARDPELLQYAQDIVAKLRDYNSTGAVRQRAALFKGTGNDAVPLNTTRSINELINKIESNPKNISITKFIADVRNTMKSRLSEAEYIKLNTYLSEVEPKIQERLAFLKTAHEQAKQKLKEAGLSTGARTSGGEVTILKGQARLNYNQGLIGLLRNAIDTQSDTYLKDFFGKVLGGDVYNKAYQRKYTGIIKTERQEKNAAARFSKIEKKDSLVGTLKAELQKREIALRATSDPDYDIPMVIESGSVLPSLTEGRTGAQNMVSRSYYRNLLMERAQDIEATMMENAEFAKKIRAIRAKVDKLEPAALQANKERVILSYIKQEPARKIKGTNFFRIDDMVPIETLPKSVQKQVIKARKLKLEAAKIMESEEFLVAKHEDTLNRVLHELAYLDAHKIVNVRGESGLFLNTSGLTLNGPYALDSLIRSGNFTAAEWESLFVPGPLQEAGKLKTLTAAREQANAKRLKFAEIHSKAQTKTARSQAAEQFAKADEAFIKASEALDLYKSRTSARRKLNALIEKFEDPEVARALGVKLADGKQPQPEQVAQAFVKRHLDGVSDDGSKVIADTSQIVNARRRRLKKHWESTDSSKLINELNDIQQQSNKLVLGRYAENLEEQYASYVAVLEELQKETQGWAKSQSQSDAAVAIKELLDNPKKSKIVIPEQVVAPDGKFDDAMEQEVKKLLNSGDAKSEEQALQIIEQYNQNLGQSADVARNVSNALDETLPKAPLEAAPEAAQIRAGFQQAEQTALNESEVIKQQIENLQYEKLLKEKNLSVAEITKVVSELSQREKTLLAAKAKRMEELAQIDSERLNLINKVLGRKVGGNKKDPVERLMLLSQAQDLAVQSFDQAQHLETLTANALADSSAKLDMLTDVAGRAKLKSFNINSKELDWIPDFEAWRDEAVEMIQFLSKNNNVSAKTQKVLNAYIDGVNALHLSKAKLGTAESDLAAERGLKMLFDETGIGANMVIKELEKGYEFLNKEALPNVMVKQAYAEILRNANTFRDPLAGAQLARLFKKWNSYWKPLATATPGFHVRNTLGNLLAMPFGGAKLTNLGEAIDVASGYMRAMNSNIAFDDWVKTLSPEKQVRANGARWALAASGGGVLNDIPIADNFVQNLAPIKWSKKAGYHADEYARFIFSYDAIMQGFSPEQAAMRTKRFYIDYEDVSSLDKTMRQIVPFWMWTSRNVVTQLQNMWLNPRPYAVYNSFVRNFRDKDDQNAVSKSWRDLGAFKLPFGKDLYAIPDFAYPAYLSRVAGASEPSRFLSELTPVARVPAELISGKQFYTGRPFKEAPVQVEGVGFTSALQPLAQLLGQGQTNAQGQKFINEKFAYGVREAVPQFGILDRIFRTTGKNAGDINENAIRSFVGSPIKRLTPEMQQAELLRRLFDIQKAAQKNQGIPNQ